MNTKELLVTLVVCIIPLGFMDAAFADGHGPAFALATPTLIEDQWTSDTAVMDMSTQMGSAVSYREMASYGITEDLTTSFAFPLAQGSTPAMTMRGVEGMMGAGKDLEGSLLWRFDRTATGIGERRESSLLVSVWDGRDAGIEGLDAGPGFAVSAVTGYTSRSTYWWLGGGIQHYLPKSGGQLGNLYYLSGVWAWRPEYFRRNAPASDWRLLVEALAESSQRNTLGGTTVQASGGHKVLAGPSALGLYGAWGIEAGVLFPLSQSLNGNQPKDRYMAKAVFTYWF